MSVNFYCISVLLLCSPPQVGRIMCYTVPVCLSVYMPIPCPLLTQKWKTNTTFKLREEITHIGSN